MGARRRVLVSVATVLSAFAVVLVSLVGSAGAIVTHPLRSYFSTGSYFVRSLAVDQSGDVYAYDGGNNGGSVYKFDASGTPVSFSSSGTNTIENVGLPGGGEGEIAIDDSTAATKGDIYVATSSRVAVYAPSGEFLGELNGGVESEVKATEGTWGAPCGVAVDGSGDVYVGLRSGHVYKYAPSANPVVNKDYSAMMSGLGDICSIAVDSAGSVYAASEPNGPVYKYEALQFGSPSASGSLVSTEGSTLSVDASNDDVYVDQGSEVLQYSSSGELLTTFNGGEESLNWHGFFSTGVAATAGTVYVTDTGRRRIDVLGPEVALPTVVLGEAVGVGAGAEMLHGSVNPEGVLVTACRFEYRLSSSSTFEGATPFEGSVPCVQAPGSANEPVEVSAEASGLAENAQYEVRLVAENANGEWATPTGKFTTLTTPLVRRESPREVAYESATIEAQIAPMASSATYRIEYGLDTTYGMRVPAADASLAGGNEYLTVKQSLSGLQAGTTYHYRVVATNPYGTTHGADHLLRMPQVPSAAPDGCPNAAVRTLQNSSLLPECRAWELVSPAQKEGANIAAQPSRTQSSLDGNAIHYFSKIVFGDANASETPGAEYISERGQQGWVTHAINPAQRSESFGVLDPARYLALSPDLSKGIFFGRSPVLAGHPDVEDVQNLYLRNDLLTAGAGNYEILSEAFAPVQARGLSQKATINLDWVSADWKHILFDTYSNLTPETAGLDPSLPKVYEWDDGVLSDVGILPDSACAAPPCLASEAIGGNGGGIEKPNFANGPTFYEDWTINSISSDGSRTIFEAAPLSIKLEFFNNYWRTFGNLYMRIDKTKTIQLNVNEPSGSGSGAQAGYPAHFLAATPDDSKVLFEANDDLYLYDMNAPSGHHLTLLSVDGEPADTGLAVDTAPIPAMSDDGSFVYFFAPQRLVKGQPPFPEGKPGAEGALYVWHDGTLRLVTYHAGQGSPFDPPFWGEGSVAGGYERGVDEFRMSADGSKIVFASANPYTAERAGMSADMAHSGHVEIYMYDYNADKMTCASCNPSGALPVSNAGFETKADANLLGANKYLSNAFSSDTRFVFFDTGDPLVAQDTNGRRDVYEYDTVTGQVHLLSDGACNCDATFADATPDGSNVFFTTRQRLVRMDTDKNTDMYDARVNGGILAQNEAPPSHCEGEECRGPARSAPTFSTPSSASFSGVGNPPAPPSVAKAQPRRKRPTLAQALRACKRKPRKQRARCQARVRKAYRAKRSTTVKSTRRNGR